MGEAATKDPSMEDILSSIRKIIAEEGNAQSEVSSDTPEILENQMPAEVARSDANPAMLEEVLSVPETPIVAEEPTVEQTVPAPEVAVAQPQRSLQDIANQVVQAEAPIQHTNESVANNMPYEASTAAETIHVQMEDAVAPVAASVASAAGGPATVSSTEEVEAFRGALVSPSVDDAVTGSFDRLKRSVGDDLDAKAEAILRPMLREWLDENLPTMVERLVREEIERVARGGV